MFNRPKFFLDDSMRKGFNLITIIALLVLVFIAGYFMGSFIESKNNSVDTGNHEDSKENSTTNQNNTFLLTLSMEKPTYKLGEQINVTIILKNIFNETIEYEPFALGLNTFFNITNSIGGRISENWIDAYWMEKESLNPGEIYSNTVTIQNLYSITEPDTYSISAIIHRIDNHIYHSNNEIEFTVVE
jgi:hypothetical protein